ncbi:hypothetical protein WJX73_006843 [Symbiochloris irregularis]|uniref:tRNA pseudouridine synthase n=1 Tax=Symbiochloris irregularis TaxID=706552 RepID=A0AAW1NS44_9CHLO
MAGVAAPESLTSDRLALTTQSVFHTVFPAEQLNEQTAKAFLDALCLITNFVNASFPAGTSAASTSLGSPPSKKRPRGQPDFTKYQRRYVALKIVYLGWDYSGFATQNSDTTRTVEDELYAALRRTCLIPHDSTWQSLQYSRCGRTDKGVSAASQVIALHVRSQGKAGEAPVLPPEEVDFPLVLNRALPESIRVLEWADVPHDFSARFSTQSREYKYHIVQDGSLNVSAMREAAQHLLGDNDFRSFCKELIRAAHFWQCVSVASGERPIQENPNMQWPLRSPSC